VHPAIWRVGLALGVAGPCFADLDAIGEGWRHGPTDFPPDPTTPDPPDPVRPVMPAQALKPPAGERKACEVFCDGQWLLQASGDVLIQWRITNLQGSNYNLGSRDECKPHPRLQDDQGAPLQLPVISCQQRGPEVEPLMLSVGPEGLL